MRSLIIKEATTMVLLSPATKQSLGLRAQIEAIRASTAEADIKDPDIFKARTRCICHAHTTSFRHSGGVFSETDGDADPGYVIARKRRHRPSQRFQF
jgi:hypothetical protein